MACPTLTASCAHLRSSGPVLVDSQEADGYGGSQIAFFLTHGATYLVRLPQVHRGHDIIVFDPRGLGASTAIGCPVSAHDPAVPEFPLSPGDVAKMTAHGRAVYQGCRAAAGSLVAQSGLLTQAADVNAIRRALGAPRLDWLGQSVGAELGAVYAARYPGRVGRMVLDTVVDPWRSPAQRALDSARSAEAMFSRFANWCDATPAKCPLAGRDPGRILRQLTARGTVGLTGSEVAIAFGQFMLAYPAAWPPPARALAAAEAGEASDLTAYTALTYGDPDYTGSRAGVCADGHVAAGQLPALAAAVRAAAPLLGGVTLQWDNLVSCAGWPRVSRPLDQRLPARARPAATVLVTATSADSINAPTWARDVARRLGGRLLTTRTAGHGALDNSRRAAAAIDAYLATGALPPSGATRR